MEIGRPAAKRVLNKFRNLYYPREANEPVACLRRFIDLHYLQSCIASPVRFDAYTEVDGRYILV